MIPMKEIIYVTGNKDKFQDGERILKNYGYQCVQEKLNFQELQEIDGEIIAKHKAKQAYEQFKQPLFINDTVWMIPALNNFPGAFMKYTNDAFAPEDWLRLMHGIGDRRAILREFVVYKDENYQKVFYRDVVGEFLNESSGINGESSDKVISLSGDNVSIAKSRDTGGSLTSSARSKTSYDLLGEWLQTTESSATRNLA